MEIVSQNDRCYRIGIYVRESRDDNEENYETIETQRDLLLEHAQKNKLGEVVEVYIDDNMSGSVFERNGLERLKGDITAGRINLLLLKDLSRLGRNNAKTLLFLDFLEEYGIRVITYDGRYDSVKDNDTVGIDTWFNERYVRDISRKIRANIKHKIAKGEYIGHAPYGYKKSDERKNKLIIDETRAHVIREIFGLYRKGYGYSYIAKQLDLRGHLPPSSRDDVPDLRKRWNSTAVRRILCNKVYVGDTVQGISEKVSFKSKKTRRLPEEDWVTTRDTHEPIIGREEFEEAQRIRKDKNVGSGPHKGSLHIFRGLIYCGKCGSVMFARLRKERPVGYICSNYAKNGKMCCTSHYINEDEVRESLKCDLAALLEKKEIREKLLWHIERDLIDKDSSVLKLAELERLLKDKQRQQDVLYGDRLEGRISEQLFKRLNAGMENKIALLMKEVEKFKNREEKIIKGEDFIEYTLRHIKENKITHEIAKLLIKRITVYDKEDGVNNSPLNGIGDIEKELIGLRGAVVIEYSFRDS